jgi:hypothetical protein
MSHNESASDMSRRLDSLEKRLKEKEAELSRIGRVSQYRKQIDDMFAKAGAIRQKLVQPGETPWEAVKDEVGSDWEILSHGFERWVAHVDSEFGA